MAEQRKPALRISFEGPDGKRKGSLYPAGEFPGGDSAEGRYRLLIGRSWWQPGGQKYAFVTPAEAFAILAGEVADVPAVERPDIPVGSWVRVITARVEGVPVATTRSNTRTEPYQGVDGRWRVVCMSFKDPVFVDDLAAIEVDQWASSRSKAQPWKDEGNRAR